MEFDALPQIFKLIAALVFVVSLMGGLALVLKRLGLSGAAPASQGKEKRLKVIESLALDPRRRLLIIQRDNAQHLILLGGSGETVIETGIKPKDNKPNV